jgi:hypothetical protein
LGELVGTVILDAIPVMAGLVVPAIHVVTGLVAFRTPTLAFAAAGAIF